MKFELRETADEIARDAAASLRACVAEKSDLVLCAASGASPTATYAAFIASLSTSATRALRIVKLDEWGGLALDDPASCETYVRRHLVVPMGMEPARYLAFDGTKADRAAECERVRAQLESWGGIDVAVLGVGRNGHLGFIEPASALSPHAHVATLSTTSLGHAMLTESRNYNAATDGYGTGLTLGMADLLAARHVVAVVTGEGKREVVRRLREPQVSTQFPASFLWLHPRATVFVDRAAWG